MTPDVDRRAFLIGLTATAVGTGSSGQNAAPSPQSPPIGIQIGAVSFLDEGTENVLDVLQERAHVNALFVAAFTYGRGIAGRQIRGFPLPDHGKQEYDPDFHGGNFATPHPQYYRDTVLQQTKAPDHGNYDVLEAVVPAAKKRGIKTYTWSEDVWRADVPNIEQCVEVDLYDRPARTLCFNNPNYHNFLLGLHEDFVRSYEIDGIMWGSERCGAFLNAIESIHRPQGNDPARVTCFCRFCQAKAKQRGISVERAREGFRALENWVRAGRAGQRPSDGYWVALWRILFRYPEVLAWETMWNDSVHETYAAIYERVKSIRSEVQVGWHVWHAHSFSPFFRAQTDFRELAKVSDYLKITVYNNAIGGPRLAIYVDSVAGTVFHDVPEERTLQVMYDVLNYREAPTVAELYQSWLSPDYVQREIKRAVDDVAGTPTKIWSGIDVDIPSGDIRPEQHVMRCTPEGVKAVTVASFRGGAHGLLISRKYSEMRLANLGGVAVALRELRLA